MSHLQYFSYPGFGDRVLEATWYSQAVRIGDRIEISGQGGWNRETSEIDPNSTKQLEQAFDNVEHTLKAAGAEGWKNVYGMHLYHKDPLSDEDMATFVRLMKQYCPNHRPILTGFAVQRLAFDMKFEIEVRAHVPSENQS